MKISIAMATYNGEKYLQEQLDSFVTQTRQPDELVVCDDGSNDGTIKILENFRQSAPFKVRLYKNEANLGFTKNFEKTMSLCTGDIIFLSDQDDVWFNLKIAEITAIFSNRSDLQIIINDMIITEENLKPTAYTQLGQILAIGRPPDTYVAGCATAFRRLWLRVALPIPSEYVTHDNWIHRLSLGLGVRMVHEQPLQLYRRHGENSSECLASRPVGISVFRIFCSSGLTDATQGWKMELARTKQGLSRLIECTELLGGMGLQEQQIQARSILECRSQAIYMRIKNVAKLRILRWPYILVMLLRGEYQYFVGWKSAVKDILSP